MELIFGTHNANKVLEISKLLPSHFKLLSLKDLNHNTAIVENGATLKENALIKAKTIHRLYRKNCFADDSGLEVKVLNGAPGVYSARYAGNHKSDEDNTVKLLHNLKNFSDRSAQFRTVIALIFDQKEYFFEGIVGGEIALQASGKNGFGYDPIFIPKQKNISFGQMSLSEKNKISHRARAFEKLIQFLKSKNSF
jgi:XTP/dITP diphosphohydrolase